jgi:hypothetical protein
MAASSVNCALPNCWVRGRNGPDSTTIVSPGRNHGALQNYLETPKLFGNGISKYFSFSPK